MNIWLIMVAGGLGAICRYLLGLWMMKLFPKPPIPVAMLFVNGLGSLGLGVFLGSYFAEIPTIYENKLYVLIGIGFFGAFTTFSTFSVEAMQLIRDQKYRKAIYYVAFTIVGSITLFLAGFYVSLLN